MTAAGPRMVVRRSVLQTKKRNGTWAEGGGELCGNGCEPPRPHVTAAFLQNDLRPETRIDIVHGRKREGLERMLYEPRSSMTTGCAHVLSLLGDVGSLFCFVVIWNAHAERRLVHAVGRQGERLHARGTNAGMRDVLRSVGNTFWRDLVNRLQVKTVTMSTERPPK